MVTKVLFSALALCALSGAAYAADTKPLNLSLPDSALSDDWYGPSLTPTSATTPVPPIRSGTVHSATADETPLVFNSRGDQLSNLRAIERRLTTFRYGSWDVRLKPRSSDRGSLDVSYNGLPCPATATCRLTFTGQRVSLYKFVRDGYEGREVGNYFVDEHYRRPFNPQFDGVRERNEDNINIVMVTFRMTWR